MDFSCLPCPHLRIKAAAAAAAAPAQGKRHCRLQVSQQHRAFHILIDNACD